jgi:hypothetical protein
MHTHPYQLQVDRILRSIGSLIKEGFQYSFLFPENRIAFRVFTSRGRELFWDYTGTTADEINSMNDEALLSRLTSMLPKGFTSVASVTGR